MVAAKEDVYRALYLHIFKTGKGRARNCPRWKGVPIIKMPSDMILYAQAIQDKKPDFIVETGTKFGGSALFFADMMELIGHGQVVTVDIRPAGTPYHPRIKYITAPSTSTEAIQTVRDIVGTGSCMVVLDSLHTRRHVKRELTKYGGFVTKGQYMVVEDCYGRTWVNYGPGEALAWFLPMCRGKFETTNVDDQFMVGITSGGWLIRQ